MTNTQLLDDYIAKSGLKVIFLCNQLGISREAFRKKKNNLIPFKTDEIEILCSLLNIKNNDRERIFFAKKVD